MFNNLLIKISHRKFWYSIIIIFSIGLLGRYLINYFVDVNIFKEYFNPWSLGFYLGMAINSHLIPQFLDGIDGGINYMNPAPGNAGGGGGAGGNASGSNSIPVNPAPAPNPASDRAWTFMNGVFNINDPTGIAARGFLNPATGLPYPSYQPYASRFADAMQRSVDNSGIQTQHINDSVYCREFTDRDIAWYKEFMQYTYPNRNPSVYANSRPVRKAIAALP